MQLKYERTFDSFESFLTQVRKPITRGNCPHSESTGDDSWSGGSLTDAYRLADVGWAEGLAKMESLRGNIKGIQPVSEERHAHHFAESGDEVDVDRYITGEPEQMIEYHTQFVPVGGRVVKIVVNLAVSCGVSHESIFRRGAVVTMLADAIEQAGLRTEIWITSCWHKIGTGINWIKAKEPNQPLELDRMAFMMAHPAFVRRLLFRICEQLSNEDYRSCHGENMGYPTEMPNLDPDWVYIGAMHLNQIKSDADAIQFVNDTLAKYTEPVTATA